MRSAPPLDRAASVSPRRVNGEDRGAIAAATLRGLLVVQCVKHVQARGPRAGMIAAPRPARRATAVKPTSYINTPLNA
jgi:hypothetical protein